MIPKEQNTPAYTSRRYSWPGKKAPRVLEEREKSGGASVGSFSPDADYERRVSYRDTRGRGWSASNGCDLVNVPESRNQRDKCDNYTVASEPPC